MYHHVVKKWKLCPPIEQVRRDNSCALRFGQPIEFPKLEVQNNSQLWKVCSGPSLTSTAAQKMGNWSRAMLFPVLPFFWGSTRYLGYSQWVGCPAEGTGITHVQVLQHTSQVKHMATLCLFWPVHRTQTDGTHVGHLKHGIGPFLSIASIQHRLS
ncbi:hypothetical protein TNCV_3918571 [Trichonephila clavipes]|nr:hypothetical protein TNCV_3918571 [Trichonephila clavipes]